MGRVVKRARHQTGRSDPVRDALYHALPPGKRISRSGKIYYEYRRNRSDLTPDEKPKRGTKKKQTKKKTKKKKTTKKTIPLELPVGYSRSTSPRTGHSLHFRNYWFVYDKRTKDWKPKRAEKVQWEKTSTWKKYGTGVFKFKTGQIVKHVTKDGTEYYIVTKDGLKELKVKKEKQVLKNTPFGEVLKLTKKLYLGNRPVGKDEIYKVDDSRVHFQYLRHWFSAREYKKLLEKYGKKK